MGGFLILAVFVLVIAFVYGGAVFVYENSIGIAVNKYNSYKNSNVLDGVLSALNGEGYFLPKKDGEEVVIHNEVVSELISEASRSPGFFWAINKRGLRVVEIMVDNRYRYALYNDANSKRIGFNWRGAV